MRFNAHFLDYIQRINLDNSLKKFEEVNLNNIVVSRKMIRINGYSRLEKQAQRDPDKQFQLPSEDILYGLHRLDISLAYYISCINGKLSFYLGTWTYHAPGSIDKVANEKFLDETIGIIEGILGSSYPGCDITPVSESKVNAKILTTFSQAGLVRGIPTLKPLDFLDGSFQIDRLIRSLQNHNWGYLVLARPVKQNIVNTFRLDVMSEQKTLTDEIGTLKTTVPLFNLHMQMLEILLNSFTQGLQSGFWRTGLYIMGDEKSYNKLVSILSGVFTGANSLPESINVLSSPGILRAASSWILPDTQEDPGPGQYTHPLKYQSFLSSSQLSSYVHLPNIEKPGLSISTLPDFDVVPAAVPPENALLIGNILSTRSLTKDKKEKIYDDEESADDKTDDASGNANDQAGAEYNLDLKMLNKHCFVSGTTGAGKTNTIFNLLISAKKKGVNFLAIESAKAEYRNLRNFPLLNNVQIFTPGNENISPFRLNPFEVLPGIPVSVHLDLLRSVFNASFGMWTPLPQVLEQCLHRIYEDRGWDLAKNKNSRLTDDEYSPLAFPTLTDLFNKITVVTNGLGYDQKTRDDIKAALTTRINSLRTGGKGAMLDTRKSIPMEKLLNESTILELEGIGDDDDKAFIIGLLFIRLVEYRRTQNNTKLHLMIIEEAHRLLTNVSTNNSETSGNSKGKAVETFANLLAEIRSYNQGVIIADQIPVKLAPDVIKNTTVKIAHRIVSKDDREVLGGSMALFRPEQLVHYSTLGNGEAIIFVEKDDAPLLVKINPVKEKLSAKISNSDINKFMQARFVDVLHYRSQLISELSIDTSDHDAWLMAESIACDPTVQKDFVRLIISGTAARETFSGLLEQLIKRFNYFFRHGSATNTGKTYTLVKLTEWYTEERGDFYKWSYADVQNLQKKLFSILADGLQGQSTDTNLSRFRELLYKLNSRDFDPLPHCSQICPKTDGLEPACLYRYEVKKLIEERSEFNPVAAWNKLMQEKNYISASLIARGAANQFIVYDKTTEPEKRKIGGCYAQHMLQGEFIDDATDGFNKSFAEIMK